MTRLPETQLVVSATLAYSVSDFDVKEATTVSGTEPGRNEDVFVIPQLYFSKPLGERRRLGFELIVQTGIGSDYGDDWVGRYSVQESSRILVAFTPAVACRVNETLSLGGGLNVMYASWESKTAINNLSEGLSDGRVELDSDGVGVGFNLSAMVEVSPRTRFGLSYRSETEIDIEGTPDFSNLGPLREAILRKAGVCSST